MIIKKEHFRIYKGNKYPPFFRVIQSIHSPLLGHSTPFDSKERMPYTAMLTLGIWKKDENDSKTFGISICSLTHQVILDPTELIERIKVSKVDYLNKSLKKVDSLRNIDEVLIERNKDNQGSFPLHKDIDNYTFFFPEYFGGDNMINRLTIVIPLLRKVYLMNIPDSEDLRASDKYILSMLMTFPSLESYAIVAALSQAIIYINNRWFI